jgi:peptidoglycan/xylan/chitin deacetylase (PgdA/CDA1 family)
VNIVINYEDGAEKSPLYGDPERETFGEASYAIPLSERDYSIESLYEYGSRAGIWRVLRILSSHNAPATVFAAGAALERHPDAAREMADLNFDFAGHGYRFEIHWGLEEEEERTKIAAAARAIQTTTGQTSLGWYSRYVSSSNTRSILQELGFTYDSTAYNDDLPYWVQVNQKPFLIIPYGIETNDARYWRGTFLIGSQFFEYMKDALDVLYDEGIESPKMMSVGIHPRIIGRPGRAAGLDRFLDYVSKKSGVWLTRRCDIADFWLREFPPG